MRDLLDRARADTGLEDFGDGSFREGLEILTRSLRDEARLNARGEAYVYPRIVGHLRQRLQVEDWYRRHPEIDEVPVAAPLFGLGLPRTGSTALSFLLAQDPDVRYLRSWESAQPCPPPSTVVGDDPRIPLGAVKGVGGQQNSRSRRRARPDGMSGSDGAGLQVADLPGLRADPRLLPVAGRAGRLHLHLRLPAPRAQTAGLGRTAAAVAAQDARARAVAGLPRRRFPRCPLRDDPPRSHRRAAVGRRCVRRHRRRVHRSPRPALPG